MALKLESCSRENGRAKIADQKVIFVMFFLQRFVSFPLNTFIAASNQQCPNYKVKEAGNEENVRPTGADTIAVTKRKCGACGDIGHTGIHLPFLFSTFKLTIC